MGVWVLFSQEKLSKYPLCPNIFLTASLNEKLHCSPESTVIPSYLEKIAPVPMFLAIKMASSLVLRAPGGPSFYNMPISGRQRKLIAQNLHETKLFLKLYSVMSQCKSKAEGLIQEN